MTPTTVDIKSAKNLTWVIYGLYFCAVFFGITAIIALIINYVKRQDVAGTYLASHFSWQINTFWFSVLWFLLLWLLMIVGAALGIAAPAYALGVLAVFVPIGMMANGVWILYRLIKGCLKLNDNQPVA